MSHLYGYDKVTFILQKVLSIDGDNSGLIRLCHVSKYHIHHTYIRSDSGIVHCLTASTGQLTDKHSVLVRVSGVFNDRNDVGTLLSHIDEVTARAMGELDSIDQPLLQTQSKEAGSIASTPFTVNSLDQRCLPHERQWFLMLRRGRELWNQA